MIPGVILILCALFLNQWALDPFLHLKSGEISILRLALIWIFDIICIAGGITLVIKRQRFLLSLKKMFFTAITIFLMVLFMECTLQILVRVSPKIDSLITSKNIPHTLADPELGLRGNPEFPEHDAWGFRNRTTLSHSEIVAIGDSQTYGTGVKQHQAWPQQLSKISGKSVYNMSLGGYGSVEGLILLKTKSLQLNPQYVIFMMFDGNDLVDAYDAVYNFDLYNKFKSTDSVIQETILKLEKEDPLTSKTREASSRIWSNKPISTNKETVAPEQAKSFGASIKQLKLFRSFFSLERTLQATFFNKREYRFTKISKQLESSDSDIFEIFECNGFKTVMTPSYRKLGLNIEDPRLQEGLRITLDAFSDMKQLTDSKSINFLVLLLPTKGFVFCDYLSRHGMEPPESMASSIQLEDKIRSRTMEYLQEHQIPYMDTLPILHDCFEQNKQPFFVDPDGHINQIGHNAIAKALFEYIEKKQ